MNRVLHWSPVALGLIFLLSLAYLQRDRIINGQNDFVQLYAAAKLVGTPDLYSREAFDEVVKSSIGITMETVTRFVRPPFYGALLKPLAAFPYRRAYAIFSLASFSSILWFVIRFSKECPDLPFFAAMSIPLLTALCVGQDTPFLLAVLGISMLLTRSSKHFSAGLILSLCAIKFHLFLFLPVLWLLKKRWRILGGAICGSIILTVFGMLSIGIASIPQYLNALRDSSINFSATVMPNLHGLVATLHGGLRLEFFLVAVVFMAFGLLTQKTNNYELLFAASLVCGLLVSFHSGIYDDVVLLPVFVLVTGSCDNVSIRSWLALILTPIPYFLNLADAPYSAVLPMSLLLLLGMLCTMQISSSGIAAKTLKVGCGALDGDRQT